MATGVADALSGIVGAAHVRSALSTESVRGTRPQIVVEPGDENELAALLRSANAQGLAVLPRGGATKLAWGNPPARADIILSTRRLNRIVEHTWADLTVVVEAGCTIRTLQDTVKAHAQRVAVDPLWPERATVGGVLSTNDTGALRLRFGGLRDLVIGVTLALADGTIATAGGKVVKNVAGYDLSKLATGALGTLGVITRAVFRLHPLPHCARTFSSRVSTVYEAQRVIESVQDSKLAHSALQVRVSNNMGPTVDVLFEGSEDGITAQSHQLRAVAPNARFQEERAAVWSARQELWSSGTGTIVKISVLPTEIAKTVEAAAERMAPAQAGEWHAVFYATGIGWIGFGSLPEESSGAVEELRAMIERQHGSLVILRSCSATNKCEAWGTVGDAQRLMTSVKRQFDPKSTLNPGRFVGEI